MAYYEEFNIIFQVKQMFVIFKYIMCVTKSDQSLDALNLTTVIFINSKWVHKVRLCHTAPGRYVVQLGAPFWVILFINLSQSQLCLISMCEINE